MMVVKFAMSVLIKIVKHRSRFWCYGFTLMVVPTLAAALRSLVRICCKSLFSNISPLIMKVLFGSYGLIKGFDFDHFTIKYFL